MAFERAARQFLPDTKSLSIRFRYHNPRQQKVAMANEQIEEITPGSGAGGGGNPLIPAIAVLVLMPVLSFVLTKFLFIPQIQGAVTTALMEATGGNVEFEAGGDAHGGGDSHGEPAADAHGGGGGHGEPAADAHGGGGDAEPAGPSGNTYQFDGIIANLSGSSMNRYVKVSFIIEGTGNEFAGIIDSNRVKLIDATITVLSSLTSLDLQNPGVKNHVRSKLIASYDAVLKSRMVEGLYFSEFVVQ